jgi:tetratricopeptide (TPR) repeat protein
MVTKIAPDFAQGYFNLGIALKTSGQFIKAIAAYQQAIVLNPNYAEAHQNLGVVLIKIGCLKEAIVAFQVAIKLYEQQNNYQAAEILRSVLQEFG